MGTSYENDVVSCSRVSVEGLGRMYKFDTKEGKTESMVVHDGRPIACLEVSSVANCAL